MAASKILGEILKLNPASTNWSFDKILLKYFNAKMYNGIAE